MKIKKYLLLLIAAFSLIVSSCNNIASDDDDDDKKSSATITNEATGEETMTPVVTKKLDSEGALAYLSVSIDELTGSVQSARTVLPDYNTEDYRYQGFTSFVLTGSLSSAPDTVYDIAKWETTTETEGETETTTTAYSKLTGSTVTFLFVFSLMIKPLRRGHLL